MASSVPARNDECDICCELLKHPRVLDCGHTFCLDCLEKLERRKKITCPNCRKETEIPVGLQVKHLPKFRPGVVITTNKKSKLEMVKSWKVDHEISAVVVDDENKLIYVGLRNKGEACVVYSFTGLLLYSIKDSIGFWLPGLILDQKKDILVYVGVGYITSFDKHGTEIGTVICPEVKHINDIAYLSNGRYILADSGVHKLQFYSPDQEKIIKSIPAEEARRTKDGCRNVYMASSKSSAYSLIATLDVEKHLLKLYDEDLNLIRSYGGHGSGPGKFNRPSGVCFDYQGRILVSDRVNHRIVRISPDAVDEKEEWELILNTANLGLGDLRMLDVTSDGFIVVAFFTDAQKGPFNVAIFSGYK